MNNQFDRLVPGLQNKLHLLVDLSLAATSVLVGVRFVPEHFEVHSLVLTAVVATAWLVAAVLTRLYSPMTPRRLWDNLTLRAIGVGCATFTLVVFTRFVDLKYRQVDPWSFAVLFFLTSSLARAMVFKPLSRLARPIHDVLIVGTGHLAMSTWENLQQMPGERAFHVVGFLRLSGQPVEMVGTNVAVLGSSEELLEVLSVHPVSEVYLAGRVTEHGAEMQDVVAACERVGMPFALPLHSLRFERARLLSSSPARDGYLHYMSTAWKPMQYAAKRLLDICAATAALAILSPLLVGVAIAIKVSSRGPVLFKQKRLGLHGAVFEMLKFRSMVVDAEALKDKLAALNEQTGPVFKMEKDPRIIGIGGFIRRYSIDELPQLINILRGDMTIVGPRPALPKEVAQYKAWQRRRLSVRPGLTCYWQVGGRNAIGFEDWMRLDLRYVDNWNFVIDIGLIAQTFRTVVAGKGAS